MFLDFGTTLRRIFCAKSSFPRSCTDAEARACSCICCLGRPLRRSVTRSHEDRGVKGNGRSGFGEDPSGGFFLQHCDGSDSEALQYRLSARGSKGQHLTKAEHVQDEW